MQYPSSPWYTKALAPQLKGRTSEAQQSLWFDAMFNAFHRDVLKDGLLLPYYTGFDEKSWWCSQYLLILLASELYKGQVLQINDVIVDNLGHSDYPQALEFSVVRKWFENNVLSRRANLLASTFRFRAEQKLRAITGLVRAPARAPVSHRLREAFVRRHLRAVEGNPFWTSYVATRGRQAEPPPALPHH